MKNNNGVWCRAKIEGGILKLNGKMDHGGPFCQAEDRMNVLCTQDKESVRVYDSLTAFQTKGGDVEVLWRDWKKVCKKTETHF